MRLRKLTLSGLVALVISLIWRQSGGGGSQAARLFRLEGLLWVPVLVISQQAISLRLRTFPAALFLRLLVSRLARFHSLRPARRQALPPALAWAAQPYSTILASDGSTLDGLLRKVGLLREADPAPLGGKRLTRLNVLTLLPTAIWFEAQATAHDQRFWPQLLTTLPAGALLLWDTGFTCFKRLAELSAFDPQVTFIIPAKRNLVYEVQCCFYKIPQVHDYLVWVGTGQDRQLLRLVKLLYQGQWYSYLTNELDPHRLPAPYVAALYEHPWRIEETFNLVKRRLGLSYFWTGAQNGLELQVWATWIRYTVLLDLTEAVAKALHQPLRAISVEMVYRGLYHFGQA